MENSGKIAKSINEEYLRVVLNEIITQLEEEKLQAMCEFAEKLVLKSD